MFLVFGAVELYFSRPVEKSGSAPGQDQGNSARFERFPEIAQGVQACHVNMTDGNRIGDEPLEFRTGGIGHR